MLLEIILFHLKIATFQVCSSAILWITLALSLYSVRSLKGTLFHPYAIFLLSAYAFNGGLILMDLVDPARVEVFERQFSEQAWNATIMLVVCSLQAFHLGALLAARQTRGAPSSDVRPERPPAYAGQSARRVGWLLIVLSLPFASLSRVQGFGTVRDASYIGLFQRDAAVGINAWQHVLATWFAPGVMFVLASGRPNQRRTLPTLLALILLVTASCADLIVGSRYWALMPVIAALWVWHRSISRIPVGLLVAAALLLMAVIFPAVRAVRSTPVRSVPHLVTAIRQTGSVGEGLARTIVEMGQSMLTVAHTVTLVPGAFSFRHGQSYLAGLATALPNIGHTIHPALAAESPSSWLIRAVSPSTARTGGTIGFSFVAEAYLNLGTWGGVALMALLGALMGVILSLADEARSPIRTAVVGSFLCFVLAWPRGTFAGFVVRPLLWYSCAPASLALLLQSRKRQANSIGPRHV